MLFVLSAADGVVAWVWPTGGEVHSDPALDEAKGIVYCATYAGFVFALKLPD